ncbi:MAG: hypothetical protein RIS76_4194 [Verrucomicrobiota bacterium]
MPPLSMPPSARTERCDYCSAPLPTDFLPGVGKRAGAGPSEARRYCCYGCRLLGDQRPESLPAAEVVEPVRGTPWFRIGAGVALASQSMLLGFAVNLTPPAGALRAALHTALAGSAIAVMALLGWPLFRASWECACRRRISVELLFLAGIIGAFGASVWSSLTGIGAVYYEIVAVLLVVYTVGRTLTARARERAFAESRRLRDTFDTCRRIHPDGSAVPTPVAAVEAGDHVRVFPGEPIPVDGRILEGMSFIRETPLTGEPYPVVRRTGDGVLAGSWAEDGELLLEATASGRARRLDELLTLVELARETPGPSAEAGAMTLADRITRWFLPLVLLSAVATFVVWTLLGRWSEGLFNALAVLLVACPCALGLATPLGLWNALATLAARGFIVRSGDALERLARVDHVVFDKTGTLSEDRQSLIDFAAREPDRRAALLQLLRTVQSRSSHPAARAFAEIEPAGPAQEESEAGILSLKSVPARGVEAWLRVGEREHHLRIGQPEWIGHPDERTRLVSQLRIAPGDQEVAVELDGQLAGVAVVRERLRGSVTGTLDWLRSLGCRITILTGDLPARAGRLLDGQTEGAVTIEGSLSPADKARRVTDFRAAGDRVLFVGDGINDAPALRSASVGVALTHGAPLATASADALLCGDGLEELPRAIALARRVRDAIRSNLFFAAFYNLLGMALAATGRLHPITAALLMVGSSTIVSWRALRSGGVEFCHPPAVGEFPASGRSAWTWILPLTFLLQVPLLIFLGQLRGFNALTAVLGAMALAGLSSWLLLSSSTTSAGWRPGLWMTAGMLGPGNLAMLLGWWVDAGFGPVMRDGVCLCCQSHHYFSLSGRIPWMYLGMLLGGLPAMATGLTALPGRLGRWPLLALAAAGMILGMGWGADLVLQWAGPGHPRQFLFAFAGMTAGMLTGMFFACAAGEAIAAALRKK